MSVIFLPVLWALGGVLQPAMNLAVWQALCQEPQVFGALRHTLISALGSTVLALLLAISSVIALYPSRIWQWLTRRLAVLLAFPHAAFAVGLSFLIAPTGFIARLLAPLLEWTNPPLWLTPQDPYALSLMLALALKESWFLLWVLAAALQQQHILRALHVAQSLGYGRLQIWLQVLLPQVLPRLAGALAAVLAYSVSVVDMAVILAPSTPPPLAVLGWQWLHDNDPHYYALGSAVSVLLMLIMVGISLMGWLGYKLLVLLNQTPSGQRWRTFPLPFKATGIVSLVVLSGWLALLLLALWSVAEQWFFPDLLPQRWTLKAWWQFDGSLLGNTLLLGAASSVIAVIVTLIWLEAFPQLSSEWWYGALCLPAVPLVVAQYTVVIRFGLESTYVALVWSHLWWVLPYVLLVLAGAYRSFDTRFEIAARALGYARWQVFWRVKLPMLGRPISAAVAVGFAVSVAQYLPTVMLGAGRITTMTTEAVALSAGGNRRTLAVYALGQALLPWLVFMLMSSLAFWQARNRRGLK
ncbi:ABC transporter permease [Thiofilum flexile]|uniref:ABC transporter permease n=1 Tax=Thiofilum flexile TaxID=125627 RepID=UPI0003704BAC|nr:ABC transporter permease subunit [Thiofilum flexile]